ncbi:MAG: hypothetical protein NTX59_02370 [Elusimicrobia bacterium]|nr:hypothetical protein [Elusimicrobiota bacterium]
MTGTDITQPQGTEGNICIECGLCCDGTLFPKAIIKNNDDPAFLKEMEVESFSEGGKRYFRLPCRGQKGKLCALYSDERRYEICKTFRCRLLRQYAAGEISYDSSIAVIKEALSLGLRVKEFSGRLRAAGISSEEFMPSLLKDLKLNGKLEDLSFRRTYSKQLMDCFMFIELLKRRFYKIPGKAVECAK